MSAATLIKIIYLFGALAALIVTFRKLISYVKHRSTAVTITFVVLFLATCVLSAQVAESSYKQAIFRRDHWTRVSATVTAHDIARSRHRTDYNVTFSFVPEKIRQDPAARVIVEDSLGTQDQYDQYPVGSMISVHYPESDPRRALVFLHGNDSNEQRRNNFIIQSIVLDFLFGSILIFGWCIATYMAGLFFGSPTTPVASKRPTGIASDGP
jgi:Protein of unknown function (DUF3592)